MKLTDEIVSKDKFYDFLRSDQSMIRVADGSGTETFIKVPLSDEVDLLYSQRIYRDAKYVASYDNKMECEGIWNHVTQTLYEAGYYVRKILDTNEEVTTVTKKTIEDTINTQLKEKLLVYVNENYNDLQQSLTQEQRESHYFSKHYDGADDYIYDKNTSLSQYISNPTVELNATTLVDYARGGKSQETLQDAKWNEYFEKAKENLVYSILSYETVNQTLDAIKNNPDHPLHKTKAIMNAMKNDCQTVNVTIKKNDTLFTFKTEADSLRRYNSNISTYRITAQDRKQFEKLFGRNADYNFHEIAKITYGKQVLYEDKNLLQEKEVSALAAMKAKGTRSDKAVDDKTKPRER